MVLLRSVRYPLKYLEWGGFVDDHSITCSGLWKDTCYFRYTNLSFLHSFSWASLWLFLSILSSLFRVSLVLCRICSSFSPSSSTASSNAAVWPRKSFRKNKGSYLPFLHLVFSFLTFFLICGIRINFFHYHFTFSLLTGVIYLKTNLFGNCCP